jgi:arsenate reductase
MSKSKVLFLCTGNSCRSQMAAGLVNHTLKKQWKAYSAGTRPTGTVHPLAIKVMAELGIDISSYRSKSTEEFRKKKLDLIVTVCDSAAEDCPIWLDKGRVVHISSADPAETRGEGNRDGCGPGVVHISFPDPAEATGTEEERLEIFRAVRDDIRRRLFYYLSEGKVLVQGYTASPAEAHKPEA